MQVKYAFRVEVGCRVGAGKRDVQIKNFELLPAAMAYRDSVLRKPTTIYVRVLVVLDETTRGMENEHDHLPGGG